MGRIWFFALMANKFTMQFRVLYFLSLLYSQAFLAVLPETDSCRENVLPIVMAR